MYIYNIHCLYDFQLSVTVHIYIMKFLSQSNDTGTKLSLFMQDIKAWYTVKVQLLHAHDVCFLHLVEYMYY